MDKKITERLIQLKGHKSDTAAAREWGIPRTTLLNLLSGDSDPKLSTLSRIATANNTTVGWIVDGNTTTGSKNQIVTGNGNFSVGGGISGGFATSGGSIGSKPPRLEDVLDAEEAELIGAVRAVGGPLIIRRLMAEVEKIKQLILGE